MECTCLSRSRVSRMFYAWIGATEKLREKILVADQPKNQATVILRRIFAVIPLFIVAGSILNANYGVLYPQSRTPHIFDLGFRSGILASPFG